MKHLPLVHIIVEMELTFIFVSFLFQTSVDGEFSRGDFRKGKDDISNRGDLRAGRDGISNTGDFREGENDISSRGDLRGLRDGDLTNRIIFTTTRQDDPQIWFNKEHPKFEYIGQVWKF